MFLNAWSAKFHAFNITNQSVNDPVYCVLVSFLAGAASSLMIFAARPMLNIIGSADEINVYDPITLLGCFVAGLVSISACLQSIKIY